MVDPGILSTLRELYLEFENNFDQSWFFLIIETLPLSVHTFREIRELFDFTTIAERDLNEIETKLGELEKFLTTVRDFLLPRVKEKLNISHLDPEHMVDNKEQKLLRQLVASNLPFNIQRLFALMTQLKNEVKLYELRIASEAENLQDASAV
jgi:hypothetical protein